MLHGCANRGYWLSKVMRRHLAVALVIALSVPFLANPGVVKAEGTTIKWVGTSEGDGLWETAGNWDTAQVPDTGDTVVIPAGSSVNYSTGTSSVRLQCAGDLTISGGTLETTGTSTISGSLVNNGNVVVNNSQLILSGGGAGSGGFSLKGMAHLEFAGGKSYTVDGKVDDLGGAGSLTVSEAGTTVTFNGPCEAATTSVNTGASATWNGTTEVKAFNNSGSTVFNSDITLYTLYSTGTIGGSGNITISKICSSNHGWRGGTIEGTGTLIISPQGVFPLTGGGEKNLYRKLVNNGTVNILGGTAKFYEPVENLGQLSISKDCTQVSMYKGYTQTETGTLSFDIGGDNAFKHIGVAQTLSLAGELHINLVNNYTPAAGQTFKVLTYPAGIPTTSFTTVTSSKDGITFEPAYNAADLTLTVAAAEQAAAPTANPAAGTYTETQNVTLATTTDEATIYYTTDGSEPTTASTSYTGPITVAASMTIKAIAVKAGMVDSPVATFAHVIQGAADEIPPVWAEGFPKAIDVTTTGFKLEAKIDEAGTAYYVVLNDGATTPSAAQVKAGQDSSDNPVADGRKGSISLTADTVGNTSISGLDSDTAYDVYVVAEDDAVNLQSAPASLTSQR